MAPDGVAGHVVETTEKSSSALRTIGEVSEVLNIPQHVLRFWEKRFSQLKPVKRRGRRYYRPEDIALLERIKDLLYNEGLTIRGAKKLLNQPFSPSVPQPDLFNAEEDGLLGVDPDLAQQSGLRPGLSADEKALLQDTLERLVKAKSTLDGHLS